MTIRMFSYIKYDEIYKNMMKVEEIEDMLNNLINNLKINDEKNGLLMIGEMLGINLPEIDIYLQIAIKKKINIELWINRLMDKIILYYGDDKDNTFLFSLFKRYNKITNVDKIILNKIIEKDNIKSMLLCMLNYPNYLNDYESVKYVTDAINNDCKIKQYKINSFATYYDIEKNHYCAYSTPSNLGSLAPILIYFKKIHKDTLLSKYI